MFIRMHKIGIYTHQAIIMFDIEIRCPQILFFIKLVGISTSPSPVSKRTRIPGDSMVLVVIVDKECLTIVLDNVYRVYSFFY